MNDANNKKSLVVLAFAIMALLGFIMTLKGALIPSIKSDFNISYSSVGLMFLIGDIGYMLATLLGGIAAEKLGLKRIFYLGFIAAISAIIGINFTNSFLGLILFMTMLLTGMGFFEIGLNSLGAKIFTANTAVMMSLLHFFYGVGSSISPKYAGSLLIRGFSWKKVYLFSLLLIGLIFVFLILSHFPQNEATEENGSLSIYEIASNKKVWIFVASLGLSVVAELGISTWLINFLQEVHGLDINTSSIYLTLFYVTFTVGRILGGFLAEKLGYVNIIIYFIAITACLISGGLILGGKWIILFSFTGFFISILYPTIMTIITKEFKSNTTSIMGFIIALASGLNMIANLIIGRTSDNLGVFKGFSSILIYIALGFISFLLLKRNVTFDKIEGVDAAADVCKA
jgi:fucose permease